MRFAILGNGKMAGDVLRILAEHEDCTPALALGDPRQENAQSRLAADCVKYGVPYLPATRVDAPDILAVLRQADVDYIVSANNFLIFRGEALSVAKRGIINFHNGPLPRYGGLHACSWALFNDERQHGVTWHLVDAGIDSGPILTQRGFPVTDEDNAVSLMSRCIREGVSLFRELLPTVLADTLAPVSQSQQTRLYHSAKDRPFGGDLPWDKGLDPVRRIARAISFSPLPNLFFRPALRWEGGEIFVERLEVDAVQEGTAGLVLDFGTDWCSIGLGNGRVICYDLRDSAGNPTSTEAVSLRQGIRLFPSRANS